MDYQISWMATQFAQNVFYHRISVDHFMVTLQHPHFPDVVMHIDTLSADGACNDAYSPIAQSWRNNWERIIPFFDYPP